MKLVKTINEMREVVKLCQKEGKLIGYVPTMGNLHQGHISLARESKKDAGVTIVSIFVNPTQFAPHEDFNKYPRTLENDLKLLEAVGVDYVFAPTEKDMYPSQTKTLVMVGGELTSALEGCSRPGHFNGVTLVVNKLFNIVQPDFAYFGQKDAQQARVIYQMVQDLNMPLQMKVMPIVRESDGLAMSSRNQYLDKKARAIAPALNEGLNEGVSAIKNGEKDPMQILAIISEHLICFPEIEMDYIAVVDPITFEEVTEIRKDVLIVGAIHVGSTRLIDNCFVDKTSKY
jgi:pantoate--beta-alanine ligase